MIRNLKGRRGLFLMGGILLLGVVLVAGEGLGGGVAAPPPDAEKALPQVPALTDWGTLAGMALKLVLVVLLIFVTVWFLRRYVARSDRSRGRKGSLTVLESQYLAPQRAIHLITVGDKVLVVGSTPTAISFLAEITEPDQVESLKKTLATPADDPFGRYLNAAIKGPLSSRTSLMAETALPPPWLASGLARIVRWLWWRLSPELGAKGSNN